MFTARRPTTSSTWQFVILIIVVMITGLSQGLLLPLLTILLERMGVPPDINGFNATALYIGVLGMMFFVERILMKVGFKRMIMGGMITVTIALLLFPLIPSIGFWFVLRIIVGMGDSALHYATQLWAVSISPADRRGRNISLYGMAYGVGFSLGPLGINLLKINNTAPFIISAVLFLIVFAVVWIKLPNLKADASTGMEQPPQRYRRSYQWAWFALIPPMLYGYMEASMNGNFPVYAIRLGMQEEWISILLPAFGIGALVLQLPLGMLSDRWNRKAVLMMCGIAGGIVFLFVPMAGSNPWALIVLFVLAGGIVGSFFSLGLAYAADILPRAYLPSANVIASLHFSIGSLIGPNISALGIEHVSLGSMFYILGAWFLLFSILGFSFRGKIRSVVE